jgi:hypothetical protein
VSEPGLAKRLDLDPLTVDRGTFVYYRELLPSGRFALRRAATGI